MSAETWENEGGSIDPPVLSDEAAALSTDDEFVGDYNHLDALRIQADEIQKQRAQIAELRAYITGIRQGIEDMRGHWQKAEADAQRFKAEADYWYDIHNETIDALGEYLQVAHRNLEASEVITGRSNPGPHDPGGGPGTPGTQEAEAPDGPVSTEGVSFASTPDTH